MWRKSAIVMFGIGALAAGTLFNSPAQGEIPSPAEIASSLIERMPAALKRAPRAARRNQNFEQFRPVSRDELFRAQAQTSKTTVEQIFNKDFTKRMSDEYSKIVRPHELKAENPYRRASNYEMQQYFDSRRDMAKWTTKEALNTQLKEFFRKGDKSAAHMQVLQAMKDVGQGTEQNEKLTPEQKLARAHRRDLDLVQKAQEEEEEHIPTKLKAKLNLIYGRGQLNFMNPIVQTAVNVDGPKKEVAIDMNKEFKKLTLKARASYVIQASRLTFNVNKKITDKISLDIDSERQAGMKAKDTAKVTYSLSF